MGLAGCCRRVFRDPRLDNQADLRSGAPFPDRFATSSGTVLLTAADYTGWQGGLSESRFDGLRQPLRHGSYFGEDYTAANLVRLATLAEENIAKANGGKALSELTTEQRAAVKAAMQAELQGIDLTTNRVIPDPLAAAITTLRGEIALSLLHHDFAKVGRRPTASISRARSKLPTS